MKQGKTLQELGRELQRQRLNRQDFLTDTRSFLQWGKRLINKSLLGSTSPFVTTRKCRKRLLNCSIATSTAGSIKIPNEE